MKMVRVGDIWLVRHAQRIAALGATLLLAACAGTPYEAERPVPPAKPVPQAPAPRGPVIAPPPIQAPPAPRAPSVQRSHPRYAPPPHAAAHWDNRLGVYVVEGTELFYRERLYYRWDGDWYCSGRPDGPWDPVAPPSVPPGLRNRY
ncbi:MULTISPECIES: hypothetical protein [Pseudomonas]|uniref:hypothetical protein n=1 Tax=Pseudomonas TaxID=286 RepID=UPI00051D1437|nr:MULTISPECIES: hypothetical protein [Pseudomonas]KGK83718.1 lipoprotein [Stutzerimonas degradans]MCQ4266618.1 hypothetical protein [Stutzerimonas degradans]OOE11386.1 hypothetical protein BSR09_08975 [Stutzerimonas degradans]QCT97157.1 hypothetical protein FEV13_09750 [Stutzerimonas degradans]QGW20315.1 hypothetical protein GOM96_04715 [Stutzerimonas degradans]